MTTEKLIRHFIVLAMMLGLAGLAGCQKKAGSADPNVDYYTCTMHPSVHSHDPNGKCPICSMDLVPVMRKNAGAAKAEPAGGRKIKHYKSTMMPGEVSPKPAKDSMGIEMVPVYEDETGARNQLSEFSVPVERQQQIGVTYAAAEKKPLHHTIRAVGMVVPDRTRHWEFVARVEGYVQKLHVTSPGEPIEEGQPLLTIYSPELSTAERELVNLLDTRDRATTPEGRASTERLIQAARRRLEQWNITAEQIAELERTRKPSEFLTLKSPFKGVVEDVPVDQGRKVMIGDPLVAVADLSIVWVWAEFYEDELSMLARGQKVRVTAKSYPGQTFEGELGLIDPFLMEMKRTARVRVDIPNPDFKLRPGMYVNIELAMDMGEGLTIPVSTVMPTGQRSLVFVDKGAGKLEPRAVQLGRKFGDLYEVLDGLKQGERVVASANFLIDAESKVQGALKSFGEPPIGATEKSGMTEMAKPVPLPKETQMLYQPVLAAYLAIQKQLAQDKLDGLAAQVVRFREGVKAVTKSEVNPPERANDYQQRAAAVLTASEQFKAGNLDEARVAFGKLSAAFISLLTEFPPPLDSAVNLMNCPMWDKSPANWVQTGEQVENPFMGTAMLRCGNLVKKLEGAK